MSLAIFPRPIRALATDYDGTLAHHSAVAPSTLAALKRLKNAGFRLILVTGRELTELRGIFPEIAWFDVAVMENGAVLYHPGTGLVEALVEPPPPAFVARLKASGIPLQVGLGIVATWEPHEKEVLAAIKELGLELQVIFNKGSVMILPSGVNKATGLQAALLPLELTPDQVAGVGDAENDHAFLSVCGKSAAVANALPSLKEEVDYVCSRSQGEGVEELIDILLKEHAL